MESECVLHGGHCYQRTGMNLACVPPKYAEVCKHCGAFRWAVPREPWIYQDEEFKPIP